MTSSFSPLSLLLFLSLYPQCDPPIEVTDLFRDIQDGHVLMALLEELSGCRLLQGFKRSSHRIFKLNNIAKVLSFLEERNVKLVSIDAADVADGNSSIILGLIWNIILFFQIKELTGNIRSQFPSSSSLSSIPPASDGDAPRGTPPDERPAAAAAAAMREHGRAIKRLLQWVQKRTRSGLAFLAVIKSIDPSLVDMRKALLRTAKQNLEDGFRIAHFSLGIPRLLEPEGNHINTDHIPRTRQ
ncbi:Calmin [Liparis tanakae]|uniref:Calmin n=1 Tax=Liparis tanakae TaxID=230148 RepID=A0A4Z2EFD1_9TELE|nr:Calmin [Liparis tanakae]